MRKIMALSLAAVFIAASTPGWAQTPDAEGLPKNGGEKISEQDQPLGMGRNGRENLEESEKTEQKAKPHVPQSPTALGPDPSEDRALRVLVEAGVGIAGGVLTSLVSGGRCSYS